MQKFRSYIYSNKEVLMDIISQIKDLKLVKKSEEEQIDSKAAGSVGIPISKIEGDISSSTKSQYEYRQNNIEDFVSWCEEKDNTLNLNNCIPEYKDKGIIVIASGKPYLPDKIQDIELIRSIIANKPLFSTMPGLDGDNEKIAGILKDSEKIPILMELSNNTVFSCQVMKKCLKESVDDFIEDMDNEFTIIAKIDNVQEEGNVEIFDIAKEILKVNRTVRRRMTEEQLKNVIIYEEAPIIKATPIIIYK